MRTLLAALLLTLSMSTLAADWELVYPDAPENNFTVQADEFEPSSGVRALETCTDYMSLANRVEFVAICMPR